MLLLGGGCLDWAKIKKEYVSTNVSYKQLSEKYGVSHSQLMKRGAAEKWTDIRKKKERIAEDKFLNKVAERDAKIDEAIFDAAMLLMDAYTKSIRSMDGEPMPPSMLKDYGTALKSIQSVMDKPTDLDIQEQKARIEKLRKDTAVEEAAETEIQIKGWDEQWAK